MRRKFILVLIFTIITGIMPALAQSNNDAPAKTVVKKKPVKETETVINIILVSDMDFSKALEAASEVELIDEETAAKNDSQEKSSDKK